MTQSKPLQTEETLELNTKLVRDASFAAILLIVAGLALFGFAISLVTFTDWQDYLLVGFPLVLAGASFASISIIRRGNLTLGSGIVFSLNLIVPLLIAFIIRDTLWIALAYAVVSSALLIWRAMPRRSWQWSIIATAVVLAVVVAVNLINPAGRFVPPANFNFFVAVVLTILSAAFIAQAVQYAWGRSMRSKLLVTFIGLTLVAAGALAVYTYVTTSNILHGELEKELTQHTDGVAESIGNLLDAQINTLTTLSLNEVLQQTVEEINNTYEGDSNAIQATLEARDEQWRSADNANNNNDPLVREYLNNQAALELKKYKQAFPNNAEVFITDVYGGQAGTTNRTSDYYQADEDWWQAAYNNGEGAVYISEPEFDTSANALAVLIAMPLRNHNTGDVIGILRTTYLVSAINTILDDPVGVTGKTDLFVPGEVVSYFHEGQYSQIVREAYEELQAVAGQGIVEMSYEGDASVILQRKVQSSNGNQAVDNLGWVVLFHQHQDEAFAPVNAQIRGTFLVTGFILLLAVVAAFGLALYLVRPITELTKTAEEVAAGNLDSRANVISTDEVGILASTFNSMTSQLQETLQGLEERVAARTQDLAIVAEVGTATSSILETKRLLQEVVDLTKERFNLYHSHIYLFDEQARLLVLAAGAGEPGRAMVAEGRSIPLEREQSLVARAARERKGVTVNDVTQAPDHLPNPLLPDTRSELAVPMIVGDNVIGVFDIQSEKVGRFTESDVNIQTTLAAQLATSIQNVRSFEQSKKEAELQSLTNTIGQKIQRAATVEETLQTAIRELGLAIGSSRVKAILGAENQNGSETTDMN